MGNSFGPGYSGASDGWVEDQVDLTPYAGEEVLVRFHYVTDDAINGTGLCLDTISLPEVGFFDDASQNSSPTAGQPGIYCRVLCPPPAIRWATALDPATQELATVG